MDEVSGIGEIVRARWQSTVSAHYSRRFLPIPGSVVI